MGRFAISLSNNQLADVRWGTVRKKFLFFSLLKKNRLSETKKGYIVTIEPASKDPKQYRLLKNEQGNWTFENEGFQSSPDDPITDEIKKGIDNYESKR
jgi:hypothetical protein